MKIKYQNEHLRAKVKENMFLLRFYIFMLVLAFFLMFMSFYNTYKAIGGASRIDFKSLEAHSNTLLYAEITEMPVKIEYPYYMVKVGGDAILMTDIGDAKYQIKETGYAKVVGKIRRITDQEEVIEAAKNFYVDNGYYDEETSLKNAKYYLKCENGDFRSVLLDEHPLGIVFGVTILIVIGIWMHLSRTLNMIKHLRPACGSVRYTPEEIDEQANMPGSVWLDGGDIYITPKIVIGTNKGMTAVEYDDIQKIYVRSRWHTEASGLSRKRHRKYRYREYYTYQVIVKTKNHKRLILCDSRSINISALRKAIEEKCGRSVWGD